MSSIALSYPTKPSEVADDLESFIYVILYMAIRFHLHDNSPPDVDKDSTLQERQHANAENEALAMLMHYIFYDDTATKAGYYIGGKAKRQFINSGCPPVELEESELLNNFLKRAYKLLHTHYKRVNWDDLKPFAVERPQRRTKGDSASNGVPEDQGPLHVSVFEALDGPTEGSRKSFSSISRKSTTPLSAASSFSGVKPLDNHAAIRELFDSIFKDDKGMRLDVRKYRNDKFFDQLDQIKQYVGIEMKDLSGRSLKRSAEEDISDQANKRARTFAQRVLAGSGSTLISSAEFSNDSTA